MERNEVHGMCGMGWSSIMMQRADWIRNGSLRILVQEDLKGHPELNKKGRSAHDRVRQDRPRTGR